jgi:heptosyltransferase-2
MKILVVTPNWIGDVLMAQPLLRHIKADPSTQLTVLAPEWVAAVLDAMPEVDAVVRSPLRHGVLDWQAQRQLARHIRALDFDRAIILPNSFKSALIPWMARIPERIGYRNEGRAVLLSRSFEDPGKEIPMIQRYLRLVTDATGSDLAPRLVVDPERSAQLFEDLGLGQGRPVIALCPGAEFGPAKRWPAAHYTRLADLLYSADPRRELILLGSKADAQTAGEIAAASAAPVRVLAGQTSLDEAIALIAGAQAVVSNDSGLMHIAAALERPQVALFGSSDPRHTPPRSARAQVLWLHLECSPCFKRVCPLGHLNCLNQIAPEEVLRALETALAD